MGHGDSDVFMSYAREDLPRVRPLVAALGAAGLTVFYDRRVPAGMEWREFIGNALAGARCVLVAWTRDSVKSQWVLREAGEAQRRGIRIIPVLLDPVEPPFGFADIQASDLSSDDPAARDAALDQLVQDVKALLASGEARVVPEASAPAEGASAPAVEPRAIRTYGEAHRAGEEASRERVRRYGRLFVVLGAVSVVVIGSFVGWRYYREPPPPIPPPPAPNPTPAPAPPPPGSGSRARSGMTFFVEDGRCPSGSAPVAEAAGRMLLATNDAAEVGKVVGVPLGDQEDRAHAHAGAMTVNLPSRNIAGASGGGNGQATGRGAHSTPVTSGASPSGLPFIQLLVCQLQSEPRFLPQHSVAYFNGECPGGWDNGLLATAHGRFLVPAEVGGKPAASGDPPLSQQEPTHEHHKAAGWITIPSKSFILASGGGNGSLGSAGRHAVSGSAGPSAARLPFIQLNVCLKDAPADGSAVPPAGMITFHASECPEGWTRVNAAAGRYIVGLPPNGKPGATFGGKALVAGENRVHSHAMNGVMPFPRRNVAGVAGCGWPLCARGYAGSGATEFTAATEVDAAVVNDSGARAPYYTLPLCRKN